MSVSSVAPTANNSGGAAALSDAGIGSGLDVNGIVSKLMQVESQPLTQLNNQVAAYQATLSAYGTINSALGTFQTAVQSLTSSSAFASESVTPGNTSVLSGTASTSAINGNYNVNVTQLAQAQSLVAAGQASQTAAIGSGASTTISFQFGTIGTNVAGSSLGAGVATGGIAAGSLTLNGTTISTDATTNSAKALAAQINLATGTTGVTATAQASSTGALTFGDVTTGAGDSYNLTVGGVTVESLGANSTLTAAQLDADLNSTGAGSVGAQLAAAGITFTGSAVGGNLQFKAADGSNLTMSQTLTNTSGSSGGGLTGGGLDKAGTVQTYLGNVTLASASPVTVGGSNPSLAGFTAGTSGSTVSNGSYSNAGFTQNTNIAGGTVTIDSSNNSLQGIVNAINQANVGVTASIINDGSSTPNRLVLTSNTTGAASSMKITVNGDSALSNLLSNDPAGTQNLTQSVAAQNTNLTVNGIAITSANNTISGAIQGVTLNVSGTGSTSVAVSQNTSSVQSAVSSFVSAYNTLNSTISQAMSYNSSTQQAGALLGDQGLETIQAQIRQLIGTPIAGANQNLNSLGQLGVTFNKDGSMSLDTGKLQTAVSSNFNSVAALFSAVGTASDNLVGYKTSTSDTQPGTYAVDLTQLAAQGSETGSAAAGLTITKGSNDQLGVSLDGINATVTLAAGTYTATSLAAAVQTAINGVTTIANAGSSVKVTADSNGVLTIASQRFSSASVVSLTGDASASLLGSAPVSVTGKDVAGTIGGAAATGSGDVLTAAAGSPAAGLAVTINGGSTGARGTVTFTQGYAYQLNNQLTGFLGNSGPLTIESNSLNNNITSINNQITALNTTLAAQQANYMKEFQALDTTIAQMNSTQTFLTQQLASIAANG